MAKQGSSSVSWICILLLFVHAFNGVYSNAGVCTKTVTKLLYTTTYDSTLYYYSEQYQYNCGVFGWSWSTCTRYRTRSAYKKYSKATPVYQLSYVNMCCSGYTGSVAEGCTPICYPGCVHGTCTAPYTCSCNAGWTGSTCNTAICSPGCVHGTCTAPNTCSCDPGWTGNTCNTDKAECLINNGGCDQVCIEGVGSYNCQCVEGYNQSSLDFHLCNDIDECAEGIVVTGDLSHQSWNESSIDQSGDNQPQPWCHQLCNNTVGGYKCDCETGYFLDDTDNATCLDIDECADKNGRCEHTCHNTIGSYNCTCNQGFFLLENQRECYDHDECSNSTTNNCDEPLAQCHNTHGGYRCSCGDGYRLVDLYYCHDIDECAEGRHACSDVCHNTNGSYYCSCYTGFELSHDNVTCQDINECQFSNGGCNQVCVNQAGSYTCECEPGYVLSSDKHSCYGEPCTPSLVAPNHGTIQCSGPQITDESCSFQCDPGYQLMGSHTRECLSDHSWSGQHVSCPPLLCSMLQAPEGAVVVSPCGDEYQTTCMVTCDEGYHVTGEPSDIHHWTQSCDLHHSNASVQWTQASSCTVTPPCDGNPCNPGVCSVTMGGRVTCDCEGTLRIGERCDTNYVHIDSIPILNVNESHKVLVTSLLAEDRDLSITTRNPTTLLTINPQTVLLNQVTNQQHSENSFTLQAKEAGIYGIQYELDPSRNTLPTEDSIVLVRDPGAQGDGHDYFSMFGLEEGVLGEGCCSHTTPGQHRCLSDLTFTSSCGWVTESTHVSSKGIVFVGSQAITLPLSITGMRVDSASSSQRLLSVPFDSTVLTDNCNKNCSKQHSSKCLSTAGSSFDYSIYDTAMFLAKNSLPKTILSKIKSIFPSWLSINVWPPSTTPTYSSYDYVSSLVTGRDLVQYPHCEVSQVNDNSLYYVLRTKVPLHVQIDSFNTFLYSLQLNPQCIVIDMCTHATPTVHFHVPSSLQPSELTNLRYFTDLLSDSGKLSLNRFTVSENGIQPIPMNSSEQYWTGSKYITVSPNVYEFETEAKLHKTFRGAGNSDLEVRLLFEGSVYHTSTQTDEGKVPGLIEGDVRLQVYTTVNGSRIDAVEFHGTRAIFTFPGTSVDKMTLPPGISFKLTYNGQIPLPFSEVNTVNGEDCKVDGFLSLDNDLGANNISFTSDCLELTIGQIPIPNAFKHVLIFNSFTQGKSMPSVEIHSGLKSPKTSLGNFYHIQSLPSDDRGIPAVMELAYSSDHNQQHLAMAGIIHNVNVSVFNSHLTTDLTLNGLLISFKGQTTLFQHYNVIVSGMALLDTPNAESLSLLTNVEFIGGTNQFKEDLTEYLELHLRKEYGKVLDRKANSNLISQSTQTMLSNLASALEELQLQTSAMVGKQGTLNETITSLKLKVKNLADEFESALNDHSLSLSLFPEVCFKKQCPPVYNQDTSCSMCQRTVKVSNPSTCYRIVTRERTITKYRLVELISWRYESRCYPCWKVLWYLLPFLSQSSCCYTESVPYPRNVSQPYQSTEDYTESEEYACSEYVEEMRSELCCNNIDSVIRNQTCIIGKSLCYDKVIKQALFDYDSNLAYQEYTKAEVNLTLNKLEMELVDKKIAHFTREHELLTLIRENIVLAQTIMAGLKNATIQSIESFSKIFDEGSNDLKKIEVLNISFTYTLTNYTPSSVPVHLILSYDGEVSATTAVINFQKPLDIVYRQLSAEILKYILEIEQSRKRRQASMMEGSVEEGYLESECAYLNSMEGFVQSLIESLNSSFTEFEMNTALLQEGIARHKESMTDTSISEISDIYQSFTQYEQFQNYSMKRFQELLADFAFNQWRAASDVIYANDSNSFEDISCVGVADCLQTVYYDLINAIEDTPLTGTEQILSKAYSMKNDIVAMGTLFNYSFTEANHTLHALHDVFLDLKSLKFWCSEAPVFINQPPSMLDISAGGTLEISCDVASVLPVQYLWKRGSIYLSSSSQTLTIFNTIRSDSGMYQCIATNSAGSISSLVTVVSILTRPVLSVTLDPLYVAYDRYSNGIRLLCDATTDAWPTPGWKWLHQVSMATPPAEIEGESGNSIVIDSPDQSHEGWYTCVAYNEVGNATSSPSFLLVLPTALSRMHYTVRITLASNNGGIDQDDRLVNVVTSEIEKLISAKAEVMNLQLTSTNQNVFDAVFTLSTPTTDNLQLSSIEDAMAVVGPAIEDLESSKSLLQTNYSTPQGVVINIQDTSTLSSVKGSMTIEPRYVSCPDGFEVTSNFMICAGCRPGQYSGGTSKEIIDIGNGKYLEQTQDQCIPCPIGQYQDTKSQKECIKCPEKSSTVDFGSKLEEECFALCQPNFVSSNGLSPCIPCPLNHYQPEHGQTKCHKCSDDSTNIELCRNLITGVSGISHTKTQSIDLGHTTLTEATRTRTTHTPEPDALQDGGSSGLIVTIVAAACSVLLGMIVVGVCLVVIFARLNKRNKRLQQTLTVNPIEADPSLELDRYEGSKKLEKEYYNTPKKMKGDLKGDYYNSPRKTDDDLGEEPTFYACAEGSDPIYEPLGPNDNLPTAPLPPPIEIPDLPPRGIRRPVLHDDYADVGSLRSDDYLPMESASPNRIINPDYEEVTNLNN